MMCTLAMIKAWWKQNFDTITKLFHHKSQSLFMYFAMQSMQTLHIILPMLSGPLSVKGYGITVKYILWYNCVKICHAQYAVQRLDQEPWQLDHHWSQISLHWHTLIIMVRSSFEQNNPIYVYSWYNIIITMYMTCWHGINDNTQEIPSAHCSCFTISTICLPISHVLQWHMLCMDAYIHQVHLLSLILSYITCSCEKVFNDWLSSLFYIIG